MPELDSPLWRFSLAFYARPGVARLCLELQDAAGIDVNLLLFAIWRGVEGEALDLRRLREIDGKVAGWRDGVVRPLRAARRELKSALDQLGAHRPAGETLRGEIAAAELKAEQLEQALLFTEATPPTSTGDAALALANLANLMAVAANPPRSLDQPAVEIVTAALASKL